VAVRVDGVVRERAALVAGTQVGIGRSPDGPDGMAIAEYLNDHASRWVSRTHLVLELRDGAMVATDVSTNGSVVLARADATAPARRTPLPTRQPYAMGEWDTIELYNHVEIGRADRVISAPVDAEPGSVMVDAPTIALRLPRNR
jgi:hypothetical protein